jgi:hypothetical protein
LGKNQNQRSTERVRRRRGDDNYFQTLKELMVLVKELGNQLAFMGLVIWKFSKL